MYPFNIFKKLSYILILNLIIFPVFFLHSKLALAQTKEEDILSNPLGYARNKFLSLINTTGQTASVISSQLSHLPTEIYCTVATLFIDTCNIQSTTTFIPAPTHTPTQTDTLVASLSSQSTALQVQTLTEQTTTPTGLLLVLMYIENRFNALRAELIGSRSSGTTIISRGGGVSANTISNLRNDLQSQIDELAQSPGGISDLSTFSTTDLIEGDNLYYTNARSRSALSSTATGLAYSSSTGVFSLASGYVIPTQTQLDNKQNTITTGTSAQYLRGDLTLATFPTAVSAFSNDANYLTTTTLNSLATIAVGNTNTASGTGASAIGTSNTASTLNSQLSSVWTF